MVLGPTIGAKWGVDKLFLLTALLALLSIWIVIKKVPPAPHIVHHQKKASLKEILTHKELLKLFFSGFMQKGLMTVFFMITPIIFTKNLGWDKMDLWKVYIPALIIGIFALPLGAILAEKKGKGKLVFVLSASLITLSLFLYVIENVITDFLAVVIFFFGFNMLEPVLQSFVSKVARANQKATALSTSNTIQYLGIFLGGAVAGIFMDHNALNLFLILSGIVGILWVMALIKMKPIKNFKIVEYKNYDQNFIESLKTEKNVYDFYEKDGVLIVRYI
jgi:predicted MFS family arabinose efflux permease